jgi:exopolysaccharide production protein ExoZ
MGDVVTPEVAKADTRFVSIQILRAVAALAVVVFHAGQRIAVPFSVGQAGVDIFFVISGFVMWIVTDNGKTPTEFIRARIFRIAPLYWIATLLMALGTWLVDRI